MREILIPTHCPACNAELTWRNDILYCENSNLCPAQSTKKVEHFAKTLKIPDKALIERMQKAGLSHSKSSDEITPSDKQALLKFLKGSKTSSSKSITSESLSLIHI